MQRAARWPLGERVPLMLMLVHVRHIQSNAEGEDGDEVECLEVVTEEVEVMVVLVFKRFFLFCFRQGCG